MAAAFVTTDVITHNFNFGPDLLSRFMPHPETALLGHSLLHELAREGDILSAESLVDAGADVNMPDDQGRRPLHEAASAGQTEMAGLLLHLGAALDVPIHPFDHTPLWLAVESGHHDTARLLVEKGANPMARDALTGQGLLHLAAARGDMKLAGLLIRSGADIFMEDRQGRIARDHAAQHGHKDLESTLVKVMHHHACYGIL